MRYTGCDQRQLNAGASVYADGAFQGWLPAACELGWFEGSTVCYKFVSDLKVHTDAAAYCAQLGANAAKVPTPADLEALKTWIAGPSGPGGAVAIGGQCLPSDKYSCVYADGTPVSNVGDYYGPSEPDTRTSNTQLGLNKNGLFDGADSLRPFLCSMNKA